LASLYRRERRIGFLWSPTDPIKPTGRPSGPRSNGRSLPEDYSILGCECQQNDAGGSVYISVEIREPRQVDKIVVQVGWKTASLTRFLPELASLMLSKTRCQGQFLACDAHHTISTDSDTLPCRLLGPEAGFQSTASYRPTPDRGLFRRRWTSRSCRTRDTSFLRRGMVSAVRSSSTWTTHTSCPKASILMARFKRVS
jgi:hypothetical protein